MCTVVLLYSRVGDVTYQGLTTETVAMVSRGMVEASVMVLQQPINNDKEGAVLENSHSSSESSAWTPLLHRHPKVLPHTTVLQGYGSRFLLSREVEDKRREVVDNSVD